MKILRIRFSNKTIGTGLIFLGVLLILLPIITAILGAGTGHTQPGELPCETLLGCGLPYD